MNKFITSDMFKENYKNLSEGNQRWNDLKVEESVNY